MINFVGKLTASIVTPWRKRAVYEVATGTALVSSGSTLGTLAHVSHGLVIGRGDSYLQFLCFAQLLLVLLLLVLKVAMGVRMLLETARDYGITI